MRYNFFGFRCISRTPRRTISIASASRPEIPSKDRSSIDIITTWQQMGKNPFKSLNFNSFRRLRLNFHEIPSFQLLSSLLINAVVMHRTCFVYIYIYNVYMYMYIIYIYMYTYRYIITDPSILGIPNGGWKYRLRNIPMLHGAGTFTNLGPAPWSLWDPDTSICTHRKRRSGFLHESRPRWVKWSLYSH